MQPRIFKRWNFGLAKTTARKGRKGHLYLTEPKHLQPTPEEDVRITRRRVQKAERDERMDITAALTPPKTYMGGFTRPRDLRAANWFPGGPYLQKKKVYESPPESAYVSHTVFLLETRHKVRHGIGRVNSKDHIIGVCRTTDFVKLVQKYNSPRCPQTAMESMDNACWPWLPGSGKVLKPTKWWGPDERLEDIMKEIYEDDNYSSDDVKLMLRDSEEEVEEAEVENTNQKKKRNPPMPVHNKVSKAQMQARTPQTHAAPTTDGDVDHDVLPASPPENQQSSSSSTSVPKGVPLRSSPPHVIGASSKIPFDSPTIRAQYLPCLASEPFWLPLLAITVSTRPLALTISRLSKARERGLPFYASMTNDDRKCLFSFTHRMTNMRLRRVRQLTLETIMRLAGHKGGFVGIRFDVHDKGRGIDGTALSDPIPLDKRIVKVQVGKWYPRAEAEYELYTEEGRAAGGRDAVDVAFMTEWGRRLDPDGNEVPLTEEEMSTSDVEETDNEAENDVDDEHDPELEEERLLRAPTVPGTTKYKLKPDLRGEDEAGAALRKKLAYRTAQHHRSVIRV